MYHNQEVIHSGEYGDGICFIINGIVKVAFTEATNMQDYYLGSGTTSPPLVHVFAVRRLFNVWLLPAAPGIFAPLLQAVLPLS